MKIIKQKQNARFQDILQAAILFGFTLYFVGVVVSGSVYRYVHERQVPMLLFSAAVFCIIGILKLKDAVQKPQRRSSSVNAGDSVAVLDRPAGGARRKGAGLFGIAVFAVALVGMSAVLGTEVRFSQFAYTGSLGERSISSSITAAPIAADSFGAGVSSSPAGFQEKLSSASGMPPIFPMDASSVAPSSVAASTLAKPALQNADGIIMDNDTFTQWLSELYTKPDVWVGKKITATGSVWKDEELFEKNEFALARMMMVCCAADMQPVGILAQWNDVQTLTDGEWVEVTGTLSKKPYKDSFDPLIIVRTIKKIEPPQQAYIYP